MRTTHLPTTCALVTMPLDVSSGWEGGWVSLQVNKLEQVTRRGRGWDWGFLCDMSVGASSAGGPRPHVWEDVQ